MNNSEIDLVSYDDKNRYFSCLDVANIKYDSYLKKEKIIKLFNEKLDRDISSYDKILEFLETL